MLAGPWPPIPTTPCSESAAGFTLVLLAYLGTGVFLHLAYERSYWFMIGLVHDRAQRRGGRRPGWDRAVAG